MYIALMTIEFQIPGCRSLKEKRRTLSGLRERFGKLPNVAVCESEFHDTHERAEWSFVAAASTRKIVDSLLDQIEAYADEDLDAVILKSKRETL
jgi:uncharacterized protein